MTFLGRLAALVPAVDCCPHEDLRPQGERPVTLETVRGEVQAAIEVLDSGHVSTARQILVTLLAALDNPGETNHG